MNMELLIKIFRFGLVGITGTFIDFSTAMVLKEKLRANKYFANTLGFSIAALNNFYLNCKWTFKSTDSNMQTDFFKFILFALMGPVINNSLLYLFHEKIPLRFYTAKASDHSLCICLEFHHQLSFQFSFLKNGI